MNICVSGLALIKSYSQKRLAAVDSLDKVKNTYGSLNAVPSKYKPIAQYFVDVEAVTESLVMLARVIFAGEAEDHRRNT